MRKTLQVFRTFEDGRRVPVGRAETVDGNVVFRYDGEYLATFEEAVGSLSPLTLPYDATTPPRNRRRKSVLLDCPASLRRAFPTVTVSGSWTGHFIGRACRAKPSRR